MEIMHDKYQIYEIKDIPKKKIVYFLHGFKAKLTKNITHLVDSNKLISFLNQNKPGKK